jgi:hypothetical protein
VLFRSPPDVGKTNLLIDHPKKSPLPNPPPQAGEGIAENLQLRPDPLAH